MRTLSKFHKHVLFILLSLAVLLSFIIMGGYWFDANRCHLVECPPATWETIQEIAIEQAGDGYRIASIIAYPARWNKVTETGPAFIRLEIDYVSLEQDNSSIGDVKFAAKILEFDDRRRWLSFHYPSINSRWYFKQPPILTEELLRRVTVHPREAYNMTWKLAEEELSRPISFNDHIFSFLLFDDGSNDFIKERYGCELVWAIHYSFEAERHDLDFFVDAQTGRIISVEPSP